MLQGKENYLKDIKFKEQTADLKNVLYTKIPNNLTVDGCKGNIINTIRVESGWRGNYDCGVDPEGSPFKGSITVSTRKCWRLRLPLEATFASQS
jgi:hypothetical protein